MSYLMRIIFASCTLRLIRPHPMVPLILYPTCAYPHIFVESLFFLVFIGGIYRKQPPPIHCRLSSDFSVWTVQRWLFCLRSVISAFCTIAYQRLLASRGMLSSCRCRFGCHAAESVHHLFNVCPTFDEYRPGDLHHKSVVYRRMWLHAFVLKCWTSFLPYCHHRLCYNGLMDFRSYSLHSPSLPPVISALSHLWHISFIWQLGSGVVFNGYLRLSSFPLLFFLLFFLFSFFIADQRGWLTL